MHLVGTAVGIDLVVVAALEHPVPADLDLAVDIGLGLAVDIDLDFDLVFVALHVFDLYRQQEVDRHCKMIVITDNRLLLMAHLH